MWVCICVHAYVHRYINMEVKVLYPAYNYMLFRLTHLYIIWMEFTMLIVSIENYSN